MLAFEHQELRCGCIAQCTKDNNLWWKNSADAGGMNSFTTAAEQDSAYLSPGMRYFWSTKLWTAS